MNFNKRKSVRVAIAAVVGGTLIPLGGAVSSASAMNWDAVAACESGGNWGISTGNGYHGGLQFTRSTWLAYGGGAYATTANRASKAQQIAVAERVLAGQGPGAWPVCSHRGGGTASRSTTRKAISHKTVAKKVVKKRVVKKKAVSHKRHVVKKHYNKKAHKKHVVHRHHR